MFSLLYGLWEYMFKKEELHILMLGIDKAGKTTLLERLKSAYGDLPGADPDKILPTVGLNVGRMQAYQAPLIFWDLGGQAGLRSIWDKYYAESHALVFVVDSADEARLDEAKAALEHALTSSELFGAPLLVVANKQDKEDAVSVTVISDHLGETSLRSHRPCRIQPASAYTGEGIAEGLQWLIQEIKRSQRAVLLRQNVK
mmetsp:Transcript_15304/g.46235  ORF Transcript_15304/g.46235 Transcript_15304/m.46235 type:complete len:200 (-) Transcript_15304:1184-1783(-)|eukprot:CAMPEP_0206141758 /NCGR_PEP_ID=MMETSP1473-20131121/13985_1 /ASSEMBLY_ACC=CAM_ASM_001109 /TAXON_ID=1461547 /ORGANISM="Stichococcus sp, Strain RCC1054" /LENGTH=199 /DNA_ID=CAMNT_0053536447 /DNA_START=220 /DNA_END=819 /DNA_ORIENTATION=+